MTHEERRKIRLQGEIDALKSQAVKLVRDAAENMLGCSKESLTVDILDLRISALEDAKQLLEDADAAQAVHNRMFPANEENEKI